jgi:hypothetical protein
VLAWTNDAMTRQVQVTRLQMRWCSHGRDQYKDKTGACIPTLVFACSSCDVTAVPGCRASGHVACASTGACNGENANVLAADHRHAVMRRESGRTYVCCSSYRLRKRSQRIFWLHPPADAHSTMALQPATSPMNDSATSSEQGTYGDMHLADRCASPCSVLFNQPRDEADTVAARLFPSDVLPLPLWHRQHVAQVAEPLQLP